ncbi:MAG: hypothetical protein JST04_17730 [Bdellovibrionales bacterium]|nr:hypothetical protein [Bdellovibrionales bacterium]
MATIGLSTAGLSSCIATLKQDDATLAFYAQKVAPATTATTGIGAFTDTFYKFARANCAECHGASNTPLFAVDNVTSAYGVAKNNTYANFSNPSMSEFVSYAGNNHCGKAGCSGHSSEAEAAITAWAAVENAVAQNGGGNNGGDNGGVIGGGPQGGGANTGALVTTTLNLPANLSTNLTTYTAMRWSLDNLTPASALVKGAYFELEVQKFSATTYRVRYPKIVGLSGAVRITGIHVFAKAASDVGIGVEDIGAGDVWSTDVVTAAVVAKPNGYPASPTAPLALGTGTNQAPTLDSFSMIIGIRSNQDAFTVAFDKIETAVALQPTFASIDANILSTKCVSCHSTNNKNGGYSYSNYTDTLASVSKGNPGASRLYTSTTGTNPSMPTGSLKLTSAETGAISTWITNNAPNN